MSTSARTDEASGAGAHHSPRRTSSARQSSLKERNLALTAGIVASAATPPSRADIAAATGMTRSTASRLVDELVHGGILRELAPAASAGPGRPAVPLAPAEGTFVALGLEVNVSHMCVRAVDLTGQVLAERVVVEDFSASGPEAVLGRLADLLTSLVALGPVASARLVGAALALPGLVSDGALLRAPNLGWSELRPADVLAPALERLGLSLVVDNEANFAALTAARLRPGARGEHRDFIYLSGENGIGAGIVRDGEVWPGTNGFAGEIGHVRVADDGPQCTCGNRGCLERFAGRRAILTAAGLPPTAEAERLLAAWREESSPGHRRAGAALTDAARALGTALAAAINLLDVPAIVMGGHLAPLAEALEPLVQAELDRRVLASRWSAPRILPSPVDETPGATGGAWSLLEDVINNPAAWTREHPG